MLLLAKALLVPLASAAPTISSSLWQRSISTFEEDAPKDADDPNLWVYLGVGVILVLLGGAFAGLTIALMGQDETYLQVIATSGEGSERRHADRVLRLLKRGKHWVLVTLLLSNVITNETLPIVLDRSLGGGWPAVLSSTVLIGMFPSHTFHQRCDNDHANLYRLQSSSARLYPSRYASATAWVSVPSWLQSSLPLCGS